MPTPTVIKIGGNDIDDPVFLDALAAVVRDYPDPLVIVHGGGKEITALQTALGITPRYVDGLRITDAESLAVVEMVLCGIVNKRLVRLLNATGVDAVGLSGVDRGLVRAKQMQHPIEDMQFTGEIVAVRGDVLRELLAVRVTPVIAPVCMGDGSNYNVNADHVAGAVAAATDAARVVFLTNVPGVLHNGAVIPTLSIAQAHALIADGTIFGGMIPKVRMALAALDDGVVRTVITNLDGLRTNSGTSFIR